ncbi:MAG: tetraacyldisaccharide 4'-kinase [Candidatus Omnitrophota bacterium]
MKKCFYELATDQRHGIIDAPVKLLLGILSVFYFCAVRVILVLYRFGILKQRVLPKPVISIGNMTLGGTGKTPLVEFVARALRDKGVKSAVLIRGYMDKNSAGLSNNTASDEAVLLKELLKDIPVFVGADRFRSGQEALKNNSIDVFLLDDGFQHWKLKRDLDIVAIDASRPFGNGFLIPRGILREPLSSLSRAGIFIITKSDLDYSNLEKIYNCLRKINPKAIVAESIHKPIAFINLSKSNSSVGLSALKSKSACLLCSIADPNAFKQTVLNLGVNLRKEFTFIDHYIYRKNDVMSVVEFCKQNKIESVISTQKDAVKLMKYVDCFKDGPDLLSLSIKIELIKGKDEVISRITSMCLR